MREERKQDLIKLLKERDSNLNKAIVFYLTSPNYKKKTDFVERFVDAYMSVEHHDNRPYLAVKKIPQEISTKLVKSYKEDMKIEQKPIDDKFIDEMNEIF